VGSDARLEEVLVSAPARLLGGLRAWIAERWLATAVLGGLMLGSLGLWGGLLVTTGGDRTPQPAAQRVDEQDPPDDDEETATADPESDEPFASGIEEGDGDVAGAAGDDVEDTDPGTETGTEDEPGAAQPSDGAVVLVLDGRCEVEVDAAVEDDAHTQQAWRYPECEHAPLDPTDADERWIVVVGSYSGEARAVREAERRSTDDEPRLLWSSHYPSLTPGWWVVYEGPFADRRAARDAADELGANAYVRLLRPFGPGDDVPAGR
jgi:hypothetical protein